MGDELTGTWGFPPDGTVRLVVGKADVNLKDITVLPGIIDADHKRENQVAVQSMNI